IIPVGFARERLGACLKIASYEQGGRAHLAQGLLARNKRRSERSSRCAARAALNLTGTEDAAATLARNHRISHRVAQVPNLAQYLWELACCDRASTGDTKENAPNQSGRF
ncbi:hypothetical protein, partial [Pseudomonas juntendi]|uniref:hypothetical protein n=2 Tax=Pseudomonas TaxID=286 RepID=UPI001C7148EC